MKDNPKSGKVNRAWINDHINDPYVKQAKLDGYRARAAYKLKEIDESLHLLAHAAVVVDLGCTPGAWCQYVKRRKRISKKPLTLIGIDLLPMDAIEGVTFIHGDFLCEEALTQLEATLAGQAIDVVLSDMAPNLSGHSDVDAARMEVLIEMAIDFSRENLHPEGSLVAKVFHGKSYNSSLALFKDTFKIVKVIKPKASRARSTETYLVGMGLKEH